jgi:lipopolysaccharide transport system permease protein
VLTQLRQLVQYRYALRNFVVRELKVMYSNSALGVVWSLFTPLLMMLVFTVVFTFVMPNGIAKYPVFLLSGLLPWNFFSASVLSTTSAVVANGHLVNRVFFPREILPLAAVLSNAVNFLIALVMLFAFIGLFQIPLSGSVLWLPALILIQVAFTLGLGFFLAAVNVYFRDTQAIVNVFMLAWFFLTPVVYRVEQIANPGVKLALMVLNPVAALVVSYRQILYSGGPLDTRLLGVTAAEAALALLVGLLVFRKLSPTFAEEI